MPVTGEAIKKTYVLTGTAPLGRGTYGEVWKAQRSSGFARATFAIKFLLAHDENGVDFSQARHEADIWVRASGHPNIIPVIEADTYGDYIFIVSEYIAGGSLEKWLQDNGGKAPNVAGAGRIMRGILHGLEHLHGLDIVHQDLKPLNILMQSGTPRLTDFGLSRIFSNKSATVQALGTYHYMPPEAFEKEPKRSPQSDIWAAGVILYRLLAGAFPFPEDIPPLMMALALGHPPDEGPLGQAKAPLALRAVIRKALTHKRDDSAGDGRYQTAAAMLHDLEKALNTAAPVTSPQPTPTVVMPPAPRLLPVTPAPVRPPAPTHLQPRGKPLPANAFHEFAFATPTLDKTGKVIQTRQFTARSYVDRISGVELEMVEIPRGSFDRGSTEAQAKAAWEDAKRYNKDASWEWFSRELPQRRVTVPAFFFGKGAVTQGQWRAVAKLDKVKDDLEREPWHFKGDDMLPVESVNWHNAQEFCARLSNHTGRAYRLPSEAEWEYACRAGTTTPFPFGETITPDLVNYDSNYPYAGAPKDEKAYRQKTIPVFSGKANPFGLYNICGNVWEWCEDIWKDDYDGLPLDGSANVSVGDAGVPVLRGGSWDNYAWYCRSAFRVRFVFAYRNLNFGFRVAASAAR